ncbi:MAG: single-stranded-DNA-specific exonuclease RecJ [Candidatus Woesearchaeota archaeon]
MIWKKYSNVDEGFVDKLCSTFNITQFQGRLLFNRGINTISKADKYLNGSYKDLYDPQLMLNLDKAVEIIKESIENGEKITVYGDYDADGITSVATAIRALRNIGGECDYYIPHRKYEGYGMNLDAIRKIAKRGTKLIITVDNGIASIEEIKLAKSLGIKVVVTDHHSCPKELPNDADVIINPHQPGETYPFNDLCGCGVVWKVLKRLYNLYYPEDDYIDELLTFVGIGTVADMMDLIDENRILVKEGLKYINEASIVGIKALIEVLKVDEVKSGDIGFRIGPTINADGRLKDAQKAVNLLLTDNYGEAVELAEKLDETNRIRKEKTAECTELAEKYIRDNKLEDSKVMVVYHHSFPEGLVGLIASRIKNKYNVPTFCFSKGRDFLKASARGVEGHPFHLFNVLQENRELWIKSGGHAMAAGVSIEKSRSALNAFNDTMNKVAEDLIGDKEFISDMFYDEIVNNPTEEMIREIEILEPTGKANSNAVFVTDDLGVLKADPVGDGTHLSLKLNNDTKFGVRAIAFGQTSKYQELGSPRNLRVAYQPTINVWTKRYNHGETKTYRSVQMRVIDMQTNSEKQNVLISSFKRNAS